MTRSWKMDVVVFLGIVAVWLMLQLVLPRFGVPT